MADKTLQFPLDRVKKSAGHIITMLDGNFTAQRCVGIAERLEAVAKTNTAERGSLKADAMFLRHLAAQVPAILAALEVLNSKG